MKKIIIIAIAALLGKMAGAQTLEKMNWFNEPEKWEISSGTTYNGCHAAQ